MLVSSLPYTCPNSLTYSDKIWYNARWGVACFQGVSTPISQWGRAQAFPKFVPGALVLRVLKILGSNSISPESLVQNCTQLFQLSCVY